MLTPETIDILMPGVVSGLGGASALMLELARSFQELGLSVKLLVPDFESARAFAARAQLEGVPAEAAPLLVPRSRRLAGLADAVRFLLRYRAPVVHYHLSDNVPGYMLMNAMGVVRPAPAFVTMHSPYAEPNPVMPIARQWAATAPRHFHRVITVSERARRLQLEYGLPQDLVRCIPNGVNLREMRSGNGRAVLAELGIPAEAPVITTIGRLSPQKRPVDAIAAFADLAREYPDARLVMVGAGELESTVRGAARALRLDGRVHLVGHRTDVADWLAATTIWLLPTEAEGMSVALLEALAAGCPVVTTAAPGNHEILRDGRDALLVPVGDIDALAGAMRRVLSDAALRARLVAGGRATAERYSLARMRDAYLDCYREAGASAALGKAIA